MAQGQTVKVQQSGLPGVGETIRTAAIVLRTGMTCG